MRRCLEPDSIALIKPVAVDVFLIIDDDILYYWNPPGVITPPYISAKTMNILIKERTINLYHPVCKRISILILGLIPLGSNISIIIPKVFIVNQKIPFTTVAL
jgi:hypothetical protein